MARNTFMIMGERYPPRDHENFGSLWRVAVFMIMGERRDVARSGNENADRGPLHTKADQDHL